MPPSWVNVTSFPAPKFSAFESLVSETLPLVATSPPNNAVPFTAESLAPIVPETKNAMSVPANSFGLLPAPPDSITT